MPQRIKTKQLTRSPGPSRRIGRARRTGVLIAALVSGALLLAACGGSSNNSGGSSSSSSGSAGSAASGSSAPTADSSKAAKFSQCMRANGVPDFPDPNANGSITLKVTKGSDLDPSSSAYVSAISKCKSLEPAGFGSNSTQSTSNQNKILKFVDCMRKDGVPNFPDPNSSGGVLIQSGNGINPNSPTFQSAMQKCQSLLPAGSVGG